MSKHDLAARPMYHHDHEAINAHLTIVYAALALARHLQAVTGISLKRIIRTLRPLQHATVHIAGHDHHVHDPLTNQAKQILAALGIETGH